MLSMTSRRHNCVLSRFRIRKAAMFPSLQDSRPVRWSYSRAWIKSRTEHAWMCKRPDRPTAPVPAGIAGGDDGVGGGGGGEGEGPGLRKIRGGDLLKPVSTSDLVAEV